MVDKVLSIIGMKCLRYQQLTMFHCLAGGSNRGGSSMTSGLVGEMEHQVLPAIPPILTVMLTLAAIIVCTNCLCYT